MTHRRRPQLTDGAGRPRDASALLQLALADYGERLGHIDSQDAKAGIVMGFAAALLALSPTSGAVVDAIPPLLAGTSAIVAGFAFWPRQFEAVDPELWYDDLLDSRLDQFVVQAELADDLSKMAAKTDEVSRTKTHLLIGAICILGFSVASRMLIILLDL